MMYCLHNKALRAAAVIGECNFFRQHEPDVFRSALKNLCEIG